MVELPLVKEHLDNFVANRANASEVFSTRLVADAAEIRRLDVHVEEFLKQLRKDAGNHELSLLKKHAHDFDHELHEELDLLFKATKQDLELYKRILAALIKYRAELHKLIDDKSLGTLATSEINYANLLLQTAYEKVETLELLFRKLR